MSDPADQFTPHTTVAIVGVGLIGGSIAAALKSRGHRGCIYGVGRSAKRLQVAAGAGLIDEFSTNPCDIKDDLHVVCTPVDNIVRDANVVADIVHEHAIVTDAGSVKECICTRMDVELPGRFVGSHPLAGSEKQGFEHADPDLFVGRLCVITPTMKTPETRVSFIEQFWQAIGMTTQRMSPAEHDAALAQTSHLPHMAASVLAGCLPTEWKDLTSTGFADTTRIAAGNAELWTAIMLQNRDQLLAACDRFEDTWKTFRDAIEAKDADALTQLLADAKTIRDAIKTD